jgi:hypothetical protein
MKLVGEQPMCRRLVATIVCFLLIELTTTTTAKQAAHHQWRAKTSANGRTSWRLDDEWRNATKVSIDHANGAGPCRPAACSCISVDANNNIDLIAHHVELRLRTHT